MQSLMGRKRAESKCDELAPGYRLPPPPPSSLLRQMGRQEAREQVQRLSVNGLRLRHVTQQQSTTQHRQENGGRFWLKTDRDGGIASSKWIIYLASERCSALECLLSAEETGNDYANQI